MTITRFFAFIGVVFLIALVVYLSSTPRSAEIALNGIVTGNEMVDRMANDPNFYPSMHKD